MYINTESLFFYVVKDWWEPIPSDPWQKLLIGTNCWPIFQFDRDWNDHVWPLILWTKANKTSYWSDNDRSVIKNPNHSKRWTENKAPHDPISYFTDLVKRYLDTLWVWPSACRLWNLECFLGYSENIFHEMDFKKVSHNF